MRQRPDFRDAAARLQLVTRQQELDKLYATGLEAGNAGRWPEAVHYLAQVVAVDEQFRDAAQRLESARRHIRNRLTAMYDKAKGHLSTGRWAAAIELLEQINNEVPDFGDVPQLLQQAYAWKEQTELIAYYEQGMSHLLAGHWDQAIELFQFVKSRSPGFKDVDDQLRRARQQRTRSLASTTMAMPAAETVEMRRETSSGAVRRGRGSGSGSAVRAGNPDAARRGRGDNPGAVRRGRYPVTMILVGSVGVLVCCIAVVAVLALANSSGTLAFNLPQNVIPSLPTVAPMPSFSAADLAITPTAVVTATEPATGTAPVLLVPTAFAMVDVTATPEVLPLTQGGVSAVQVTPSPTAIALPVDLGPVTATPLVIATSTPTPTVTITATGTVSRTSVARVAAVPPAVRFRPTAAVSATVVATRADATRAPDAVGGRCCGPGQAGQAD